MTSVVVRLVSVIQFVSRVVARGVAGFSFAFGVVEARRPIETFSSAEWAPRESNPRTCLRETEPRAASLEPHTRRAGAAHLTDSPSGFAQSAEALARAEWRFPFSARNSGTGVAPRFCFEVGSSAVMCHYRGNRKIRLRARKSCHLLTSSNSCGDLHSVSVLAQRWRRRSLCFSSVSYVAHSIASCITSRSAPPGVIARRGNISAPVFSRPKTASSVRAHLLWASLL